MARPVRPASVAGSGQYGGWLLVVIIFVLPMLALTCVWISSTLTALVGGTPATAAGSWGPHTLFRALFVDHDAPVGGWPPPPPTAVLVLAAIVFVVLIVAPFTYLARKWNHRPSADAPTRSLAATRDAQPMTRSVVATRAKGLRPRSLADLPAGKVPAREIGVAMGNLNSTSGPTLYASWEDVVTAIMAPRSGKTTGLAIPTILNAPAGSPVLATSNKSDLLTETSWARRHARVWVFDPQQIAHTPQDFWWNPLANVRTVEAAKRMAGHFVFEDERSRGEIWAPGAKSLLVALLLAAAYGDYPITQVYSWLANRVSDTPIEILRANGQPMVADALAALRNDPEETAGGFYITARTGCQWMEDPMITRWVTPGHVDEQFHPRAFIEHGETLYLLSKDSGGGAAPLVAAMADQVLHGAVAIAEGNGGRLDVPLLAVLDEAANVAPIFDLPALYSHFGSRGIFVMTILQSQAQGEKVWGKNGFDALWTASTVKMIGAGMDDGAFAERISKLVGDHDVEVQTMSYSQGKRTVSTTIRRQRVLPPEKVRELPRGYAIGWTTGMKPAMIRLLPSYEGPHAEDVATHGTSARDHIAARARAKSVDLRTPTNLPR